MNDNEYLILAAIRNKEEKTALALIRNHIAPSFTTIDSSTLLIEAVEHEQIEVARALLDAGIDPQIRVGDVNALEKAARGNMLKMGRMLLEKGADPDNKDRAGKTPTDYAESNNFDQFVNLINEFRETKKIAAEKAACEVKIKENLAISAANIARLDSMLKPQRRRGGP